MMTKMYGHQNFYRWLKYNIEQFLISTVETRKTPTANKGTKILPLKYYPLPQEKKQQKVNW